MWRFLLRPAVAQALAAILVVTMAAFIFLQWRLLQRASTAQAAQAGARLQQAAKNFAEDFDREILRALICFAPRPEGSSAAAEALWRQTALYPQLVEKTEILDAEALAALPTPFPKLTLGPARLSFADPRPPFETRSPGRRPRSRFDRPPPDRSPSDRPHQGVVLSLRSEVLQELLRDLARRHFSFGGSIDFQVTVLEEGKVVFHDGPEVRGEAELRSRREGNGDARQELFGQIDPEVLRGLLEEFASKIAAEERAEFFGPRDAERERWRRLNSLRGERSQRARRELRGGERRGRIELIVTHPEGSVGKALARLRYRNFLISLAVFCLFTGALGLFMWTVRSSRRLAAQQLDFVAGVTHELLTPLAAMRSAGQNLADGVVRDEEKVRRYGALVEREGRRLSDLITQVLDFAGMQSGRLTFANKPIDLSVVLNASLDSWRGLLEEAGFEIEEEITENLHIAGDAAALERTLGNLIGNALKYAAEGRYLRLVGRLIDGEIVVTVSDRGPGIDPADLPHLFQPFYRGRGRAASNVPGSGLGLSLARHVCEHHGGSLDVESTSQGSHFVLRFPATRKERS